MTNLVEVGNGGSLLVLPAPQEVTILGLSEKPCSKCGEIKDRSEFSPDSRRPDGCQSSCKDCGKKLAFEIRQNKLKGKKTIDCPICGKPYLWLIPHLNHIHGLRKSDLEGLDITFVSPDAHEAFTNRVTRVRPNTRRGETATIGKNTISFPREYWPEDCKFVQVIVSKPKKQVYFKPFLKEHPYTKTVRIPPKGPYGHRLRIQFHPKLLGSLDEERDLKLTWGERKGFTINFTDRNDPLLDIFELWALDTSGQIMVNPANLTTYAHRKRPAITISPTIWPLNAKYAAFYLSRPRNRKGDDYLDVTPISAQAAKLLGTREKVKVVKQGNRLTMFAARFINGHGIPSGDWDLVDRLPSGALRFRLYKERNQF